MRPENFYPAYMRPLSIREPPPRPGGTGVLPPALVVQWQENVTVLVLHYTRRASKFPICITFFFNLQFFTDYQFTRKIKIHFLRHCSQAQIAFLQRVRKVFFSFQLYIHVMCYRFRWIKDVCNWSVPPSLCLSVCLSVLPPLHSGVLSSLCQKNEDTIARSSASGRKIILVSEEVKFIRTFLWGHPQRRR